MTTDPHPDFSAFRIAYDHLVDTQGLDPKQVAVLAIVFFAGLVRWDEGADAAKLGILTAIKEMGPPF